MWRHVAVALLASSIGSSIALAEDMKLPPLKKQPTPQAVIDEHMDALNKCDWNRLMAQYPADYQLICRTVWSSKAERRRPRFSQTS